MEHNLQGYIYIYCLLQRPISNDFFNHSTRQLQIHIYIYIGPNGANAQFLTPVPIYIYIEGSRWKDDVWKLRTNPIRNRKELDLLERPPLDPIAELLLEEQAQALSNTVKYKFAPKMNPALGSIHPSPAIKPGRWSKDNDCRSIQHTCGRWWKRGNYWGVGAGAGPFLIL